MKKYVAGFLVGALFTLSATAFADEIKTLIGKRIQGETVVQLNGQVLDTAIIVDGKSYGPIRSIGEAVGLEVNMKDKKIIMSEPTTTNSSELQAVPGYSGKENNMAQIESLKKRIADQESRVDFLQERFNGMDAMVSSPDYIDRGEKDVLEVYRSDLEKGEAFLEELKAQLAALK